MKTFLKILQVVLMALGVLFLAIVAWLLIADPLGLRDTGKPSPVPPAADQITDSPSMPSSPSIPAQPPGQPAPEPIPSAEPTNTGAGTGLTPSQEAALQAVGIDPQAVSNITPEQEACLREAVGEQRADEIIAGSTPTVLELLKGKKCL